MTENEDNTTGRTRGTVMPLELDRRMVEIVKRGFYQSVSEFMREAIRNLVIQIEKYDLGLQTWEMVGGKILDQVKITFDNRVAELEDSFNRLTIEHNRLKAEAGLLDNDKPLKEEQDDVDLMEI